MPTSTDPQPLLLTKSEAAIALRISRSKVEHLVATGQLKALKMGFNVRISPAELSRFIAALPSK